LISAIPEDVFEQYPEIDISHAFPTALVSLVNKTMDEVVNSFTHTIYHHASRTFDLNSYRANGILTLKDVCEDLKSQVARMAGDTVRTGEASFTYAHRLTTGFYGPCGLLVRDCHLTSSGCDFLGDPPEAVQDLLAAYPPEVTTRYLDQTTPVIVKFIVPHASESDIRSAMWFLKSGPTGLALFGGYEEREGASIRPEQILDVSVIDLDRRFAELSHPSL
jgi:hypothetical protein